MLKVIAHIDLLKDLLNITVFKLYVRALSLTLYEVVDGPPHTGILKAY